MFERIAKYRLRLLVRGVFLVLALGSVALAVGTLLLLKERSYMHYQDRLKVRLDQFQHQLLHPIGQTTLLNQENLDLNPAGRPIKLQYGGFNTGNPRKAWDEATLSGCLVQYKEGTLCVGVSYDAHAGAFFNVAGSFASPKLFLHSPGQALDGATRMEISVTARGREMHWIASPQLEPTSRGKPPTETLRITGYRLDAQNRPQADDREFKGSVIGERHCAITPPELSSPAEIATCPKETFFAFRLPVDAFKDDVLKANPVWPPEDLKQAVFHIRILNPKGDSALLFDSAKGGKWPFDLKNLEASLTSEETLKIKRQGSKWESILSRPEIVEAAAPKSRLSSWWASGVELHGSREVATRRGVFELMLSIQPTVIYAELDGVASYLLKVVSFILFVLTIAWLSLEFFIVQRVSLLTRRAATVSKDVRKDVSVIDIDLSDQRGPDELGVLAGALDDLLRRVNEDLRREAVRLKQEKDSLEAIGHEILSPLATLEAMHPNESELTGWNVRRMQRAVRTLYGMSSPSAAFENSAVEREKIDLLIFLREVAENAHLAGIPQVRFASELAEPVFVRGDEGRLEDVVTHILKNANRYRPTGTDISISLRSDGTTAHARILNHGPHIPPDLIGLVFKYGVSDASAGDAENRGQGLFVAQTYVSKMGGTISVENVPEGVAFSISLPVMP